VFGCGRRLLLDERLLLERLLLVKRLLLRYFYYAIDSGKHFFRAPSTKVFLKPISLVIGYYSIRLSNQAIESQNSVTSRGIEIIGDQLHSLNRNTKSIIRNNKNGFDLLLEKYSESSDTNKTLVSNLIEQQNLLIAEIRKSQERDAKRIKYLESKLEEISEKIRKQNRNLRSDELPNQ
jgi:hypothetical protein